MAAENSTRGEKAKLSYQPAQIVGRAHLEKMTCGPASKFPGRVVPVLVIFAKNKWVQELRINCWDGDAPKWVRAMGYGGTLGELHKSTILTGEVVLVAADPKAKPGWPAWVILCPWGGKNAMSDAEAAALTPDPAEVEAAAAEREAAEAEAEAARMIAEAEAN